jgi:hypothetical protein
MLLEFALAAAVPLTFHYDANEWTNAAYHVGCLAGHIPCSKPIYNALRYEDLGVEAGFRCVRRQRVASVAGSQLRSACALAQSAELRCR